MKMFRKPIITLSLVLTILILKNIFGLTLVEIQFVLILFIGSEVIEIALR